MEKAVLYNRASNSIEESQRLSIFYPSRAKWYGTVYTVMEYIEEIAEDESLKALYFYKIAGYSCIFSKKPYKRCTAF